MTDRTPAEQAAEALRPFADAAWAGVRDVDLDTPAGHLFSWRELRLAAEALAALTAEAAHASPSGARRLTASPSNEGDDAQPKGGMAMGSRPTISPDRKALARRLEAAGRTAHVDARPVINEAVAALRLPAQAEVEKMADKLESGPGALTWTERKDAAAMLRRLSSLPPAVGEWRPTHRHYKGGLYRETGRGHREADMTPNVYYENEAGKKFDRPVVEFDGWVETPHAKSNEHGLQRRYAPLPPAPPQETKP